MSTLPSPESTGPLREAALRAGFTADGLLELLGAPAYAALARGETVPAERATRGAESPAAVLTRLFLLRQQVPQETAAAVLPEGLVDGGGGWLRRGEDGALAATVDVRPYAGPDGQDWFVVSDLGCAVGGSAGARGQREDLVLGVGGASTTLAGMTVRTPVARALDLGAGSGIQALHASAHAGHVTATDLNPRALAFTRLTLALSGEAPAELREGSLFEPVAGETYDLIVSNPPFVISPGHRLTYRDGGMAGDELCRTLVGQAAQHLNDGGYCQLLANWEHLDGQDWRERLASWVPRGCDAWIVQREAQDPTEYAELWLRDGGDHRAVPGEYERRYDAWLAEFERRGVRGVGFGWITLRRTGAAVPSLTIEEWPHAVEQPLGPAVAAHFERAAWLRGLSDETLLAGHYTLAEDVVQEQFGAPGAEDPEHVVLRAGRGMRRAVRMDTAGAGLVGACDGTLSAGRILDAIAQLLGEDAARLRREFPARLRELVAEGFLEPVAGERAPGRAMRAQGRPPVG
ncbi:methyltransferase [Streptomyces polyrhachis]|uniref:Methyltransferase n=1 Tax=Streptomyces polyrhachis TaxID=1282885 RepID=A0ABW2GDL2_9ACTN